MDGVLFWWMGALATGIVVAAGAAFNPPSLNHSGLLIMTLAPVLSTSALLARLGTIRTVVEDPFASETVF
jgi:hypothetical protein